MSRPDLDRWNARFSSQDYVFGESPSDFLAQVVADIPSKGQALCVADGEGRNGVFLAGMGWDVTSLDFSPVAQEKAASLAQAREVSLQLICADVHEWPYPDEAYDLVVDIFSQFSPPQERARKWAGMIRALRSGGHVILQGYTPDQLRHCTGGPTQVENLYTREMLLNAFAGFQFLTLREEETLLQEGSGHSGMSAVIGMVAQKP